MKTLKISLLLVFLFGIWGCTKTSPVTPANIDGQVLGRWTLVRIVNGFGRIDQTPAEAGFSETLEYRADGTFHRITIDKDGQREEKGAFYTGANPTQTFEKQAILYPDDKTAQPYSFRDSRLLLYQRASQEATLQDGSTYEYQK
jgi:hypothetical protein